MTDLQLDEESIFHIARGIDAAELRADYLAQICAGDQALRERVEALLAAHEKQQSLLKSNAAIEPTVLVSGVTESVGEQIGRYKLLQKIGEGGFGVVYMAEQSRPVRRKVALKVIKPGMDTQAVVARFEAERQALALMDHENIAKVFDGGATQSGRPYFVMELVKGVPITEFCDENKFSIRRRLDLFIKVCRAIQHAHQKGVIHRDIKPSNVLVTLHDGEPVPKVIDFGVSKAISQQLTEKTLFTAHGQMIGTPQYMSPEQAEMSGLDVDTRSDIYSLGIMLYELLTGVTPLDPERIRSTGFAELQRLIREEEPVQPSRRCSTLGKQSALIATRRETDPQRLGTVMRGELDWIVMKTLEKDRNRRYETPNSLAKDVENYLNDETVTACPPSMAYRFQKFARRHRSLLLTGGTIALLLLGATLLSTSLYVDARIARNDALREKENADRERRNAENLLRQQTLATALSLTASGQEDRALGVIQGASISDEDRAELTAMLDAERKIGEGDPRGAITILQGLAPTENDVIVRTMLANAYMDAGDFWSYREFPEIEGRADLNSPYERLFVGKAQFWMDFSSSIENLDEAVALTPIPLSFSYRARSSALLATSTCERYPEESLERIDQAVEDVDIATRLFKVRSPDSTAPRIRSDVLGWHLLVQIHAANLYRRHELDDKADAAMTAAGELVAELKQRKLENLKLVRAWIGYYHHFHAQHLADQGMIAEAADERKESKRFLRDTIFEPWMLVAELVKLDPLETENFAETRDALLRELDRLRKTAARTYLLLAYHHLLSNDGDAGRDKVYDLIAEMKRQPIGRIQVKEICQMYFLLGDIPAMHKFAEPLLADEELTRLPTDREALEFYAGRREVESYLENQGNAGATTSRVFFVALSELANGEREKALDRFNQIRSEGLFHNSEYFIALAFAERMKRDEAWPPWINSTSVDVEK